MKKISVSIATLKDEEDYKAIRLEAINNNPNAFGLFKPEYISEEIDYLFKEWEKDISDPNRFVVLSKCNSRLIGMVKGIKRKNGYWFLRSVYLNKDFRKSVTGNSTSEEMINKFLQEVRNREGTIVRLWVLNSSKNAISLYKKIGFRKIGLIRSIIIVRGKLKFLRIWQTMELRIK